MLRSLATVGICVLLFTSGGPVRAQESSHAGTGMVDPEIERKILSQVEQAIQETRSLRLAENRLRLQTKAAVLLWPYKQTPARALLKEIFDSFVVWMAGVSQADPAYSDHVVLIANLRNELLQAMVQCDARTALAFLRATSRPFDMSNAAQANQDATQEMYLASKLAEKDPKEALHIAQEGLSKGLLNGVAPILDRLRASDSEASVELAMQIVSRLRNENLVNNPDAANMCVLLLRSTRIKSAAQEVARQDATRYITISEEARRDLINLVASQVANNSNPQANGARPLLITLSQIMPEVERYAPGQAAVIRQKKLEFDRLSDPRSRQMKKYGDVIENGTVDSLINAANKAPAQVQDDLYFQAATKALDNGETERARQAAGGISDPQRRAAKVKEVDQRSFVHIAEQGKFEEAAQYASQKTAIDERVADLVYLAGMAAQKKDTNTVRKLLNDARGLIADRRAENEREFFWQLQLGRAFSDFDVKISFEIVEGAIGQLAQMTDAAAAINGFGSNWFQDGELKPYGGEPWMVMSKQCADELALLATKDLNHALKAVQLFQRAELRLPCTLSIAQYVLATNSKENTVKAERR